MLLIVGQGNPGARYAGNRHNIGFLTLDAVHAAHAFAPWRSKFQAQASEGVVATPDGPVKCLLLKPQTFYNETGRAVAEAVRFYKIDRADVIVVHDEIDLAPGRLRMKAGGGAAGNNGVRSISQVLGPDFRRVRMGVGHPGDKARVMSYVLSDFSKSDQSWLEPLLDAVARAFPFLAAGEDERFQAEVMRLAPAPKSDPRQSARGPQGAQDTDEPAPKPATKPS